MMPATTGEAVVELLARYGVRRVFGIPGIHTLELYRGLAGSQIEHVLPRHEQAAGFMADGYARVTGRPGVCFLITGPGVSNAATAVGEAYADSVPMLVLSSVAAVRDHGRQRGRLHETKGQRSVLETVTAFSATALVPDDVPEYVAKAFSLFASGRPRPVHIEIPLDVLAAAPTGDWSVVPHAIRPGPLPREVTRAARCLAGAQRPALICGGGAWEARRQVGRLVERLAVPTFTTIAAKGLVAGDHPLSMGACLSRPRAREYISGRDVVIAIGTELAESELLTTEPLPAAGEVIRVDIDPVQLLDEQHTTIPLLSDAEAAIGAILDALDAPAPTAQTIAARHQETRALRDAVAAGLTADERTHTRVLASIAEALPPRTAIFTDMVTLAYTGNVTYRVPEGGRWVHPVGYGSLGYALPAAIGAAIAGREERSTDPVLAIVGDGGLQFTLPELATLAEQALPVVVVVWDNGGYEKIREGMLERGVTPIGVDYRSPLLRPMGEAFGIAVEQPRTISGFAQALSEAVAHGVPAIIGLTPAVFADDGRDPVEQAA